jgi:hypothetical protein
MRTAIPVGIVLLAAWTVTGCRTASVKQGTAKRVGATLPAGWELERQKDRLWIEKEQPVLALILVPNMSGGEKAKPTSYCFTLTTTRFVAPAEFKALERRNKQLEEQAERLYRTKVRQIPHEMAMTHMSEFEYHPRTREEAKAVRRYKALYAEMRRLPDVYLDGQSFFFDQPVYEFHRESDEKECLKVLRGVLTLFQKYEEGSNQQDQSAQDDSPLGTRDLER